MLEATGKGAQDLRKCDAQAIRGAKLAACIQLETKDSSLHLHSPASYLFERRWGETDICKAANQRYT
ncbi:hypothetical protein RvY_09528 [Ramazzottius varieornatus]|uniref:Uncharacterized protein n=1 Tax=Ramazzottius varieornatus TaxID=947166 RepID=A0A1D1VHJ1_RAMVA|nr:hypothetical protein RvY_09528 [Ramazzottius varieornatus]